MSGPSPIDRVFQAIVPRAVGAIDIDEVVGSVDVDELVSEVDIDKVLQRVDLQALMGRIDLDQLLERIDLDALLERIDLVALLSRIDIDQLIRNVDIDALVQRVDVGALIQRVDVNALVQQVDVNAIVGQVDLDALMDKIDIDALMGKVDIDALIARVDLPAVMKQAQIDQIVSNASMGVTTRLLDLVRRQLAAIDLVLIALVDRIFRRPREAALSAQGSLTGQVAGGITRLAAYFIDLGAVALTYTAVVAVGVFLAGLFTGDQVTLTHHGVLWASGYAVLGFFYYWIGLTITGRSIGKGLMGLRVVKARDGSPITPGRAAVRTLVYPFSFILGLGLIPIVTAKRRRALHDWAGRCSVRYDWGDRPAEVSRPVSEWLRRRDGTGDPLEHRAATLAAVPDPVGSEPHETGAAGAA